MAYNSIHYINGEETPIFNQNKHQRTTNFKSNDEISCELKYIDVNLLSNMFVDDELKSSIYERQSLDNLNVSLTKFGNLSPIIVYPNNVDDEKDGYTIIDGNKRVKILQMQGISKVLALIGYNITPQSAVTMRTLLKEKVYENPLKILKYQQNLRNVTNEFDESTLEEILNCKPGFFENIRSLQRRLKLHEHDNIHNDEQSIFDKVLNNDIDPEEALNQFDKIEKKEKKKQEKLDKENAKLEKEQGLDTENVGQKEEKASNTLNEENSNQDLKDIDFDEDAIPEAKSKDDLFKLGEQNYQQYVGDERRILPASLTKQIYARDNSQCAVCGYGGPHNMSASTVLEKHHIVDVQYGGTDNINNLVLLCPNCHRLITNFLNGKATEYAPTPEDLKNNPQNWGAVVLGNMGRIAKNEALRRIKKVDSEVYHDALTHKLTVGQALKQLQLSQIMPREFKHDPYQTMVNSFFALQKQHNGFKIKNALINLDYQNSHQDLNASEIQSITNIAGVDINPESASQAKLTAPEDKKLPTPVDVQKTKVKKEANQEKQQIIVSDNKKENNQPSKQQSSNNDEVNYEKQANLNNSSLPKIEKED